MNYKEVIERLKDSQQLGSRLGLDRMKALMDLLGNPQDKLQIIHVGGTNGKGSVCTYLTEILAENGYSTGTFLSPYLESPLDSILLSGKEISGTEFVEGAEKVFAAADKLAAETGDMATEFELLAAIAFTVFESRPVDFVVLEVGLGGRGDATNIIKAPLLSVITSVSIDHKGILGDTTEKIGREKAGIIKQGRPVISNVRDEAAAKVIKAKAEEMSSPFYDATVFEAYDIERDIRGYSFEIDKNAVDAISDVSFHVKLGMAGDHQVSNAICALYTINILVRMGIIRVDIEALLRGLAKSRQKGRLEIIMENPLIIADGAHNAEGVKALKKVVVEHFADSKILFVLGMIKGKEADLMVKELCLSNAAIVTTEPENFMRFKAKDLCRIVRRAGCECESLGPVGEALKYVDKVKNDYDVVIITGSLYLAGKVRGYFHAG